MGVINYFTTFLCYLHSGLGRGERGHPPAVDAGHAERHRRLRPAKSLRRGGQEARAQVR